MPKIQIRLTGKTGEIDGYAEIISGTLLMTGILKGQRMGKRQRPDGTTQIYMDLDVRPAPLGHLGEDDLPEHDGDDDDYIPF